MGGASKGLRIGELDGEAHLYSAAVRSVGLTGERLSGCIKPAAMETRRSLCINWQCMVGDCTIGYGYWFHPGPDAGFCGCVISRHRRISFLPCLFPVGSRLGNSPRISQCMGSDYNGDKDELCILL